MALKALTQLLHMCCQPQRKWGPTQKVLSRVCLSVSWGSVRAAAAPSDPGLGGPALSPLEESGDLPYHLGCTDVCCPDLRELFNEPSANSVPGDFPSVLIPLEGIFFFPCLGEGSGENLYWIFSRCYSRLSVLSCWRRLLCLRGEEDASSLH